MSCPWSSALTGPVGGMGLHPTRLAGMKHTFALRAEWTGNRGTGTSGLRDFDRSVVLQHPAVGEIQASAARAFRGDEAKWNPELLLLGALAQCHVLSYLHTAVQAGIVVTGMTCGAEGVLEVDADGAGRFAALTLTPAVTLRDEADRERADALHAEAHRMCFIANSISAPIEVVPQAPAPDAGRLPDHSARLGAPLAVLRPRPANRPSRVTGLEARPTEVEPVVRADAAAGVDQVLARDEAAARGERPASATPIATPVPSPAVPAAPGQATSFYDAVGGHETFEQLTRVFYEHVRQDPILAPMYPEADWEGAETRLRMFLEQYWGGPRTYSEQRGHPRLRMRHMPFQVDPAARDAWLRNMRTAVDSLDLSPLHEAELWDYLERAAHSMVNSA